MPPSSTAASILPGFERLADQHRVADHEKIDIVPLDIEADMFERRGSCASRCVPPMLWMPKRLPRNCSAVLRLGCASIVCVSLLEIDAENS